MFIIADPRGYHEPPSGPEAIRRNFCSADTCDAENKKHTAKAKNVNKFNFFMMFLPSLNLFDLNRPGDQQKPGEGGPDTSRLRNRAARHCNFLYYTRYSRRSPTKNFVIGRAPNLRS
jgi:hypothetical protein